jgi:hypothetical protein
MRRYVAVHMLVYHNVSSVRRLSKLDASTLLRRFYACRTIQRFVRRRFAFSYGAAIAAREPKARDPDASMTRAMRHILACTIEAAVSDADGYMAAYATDIERIVARLCRLSPSTALAMRQRWVETLYRVPQYDAGHGARIDATVAALRKARPPMGLARAQKGEKIKARSAR